MISNLSKCVIAAKSTLLICDAGRDEGVDTDADADADGK
jgi:hypothetical protein